MSRRPSTALGALRRASGETSEFLNSLSTVAESVSQRTTEALFGTLGGALGGAVGYWIDLQSSLSHPELPIAFASAIGLVSALLIWRGPGNLLRERRYRAEEREFSQRVDFRAVQLKKLGTKADPALLKRLDDFVVTGRLLDYKPTIDVTPPSLGQNGDPTLISPPRQQD